MAQPLRDAESVYFGFHLKKEPARTVSFIRQKDIVETEFLRTAKSSIIRGELFDLTGQTVGGLTYPLNNRLQAGFSDISKLRDNWDSYGAKAPSTETISFAQRLASFFYPRRQPEVSPELDGSIGLYWDYSEHNLSMIVNAKNGKKVFWSIAIKGGAEITREEPAPAEDVVAAFRAVFDLQYP